MDITFLSRSISLELIVTRLARIATIIVVSVLILRLLRATIRRVMKLQDGEDPGRTIQSRRRTQTLSQIVQSTSRMLVIALAGMLVAEQLGFNLAPLLAGAGIFGLVAGMGAQALVKDVLTGFFILFEDQFGVGDLIEVDGAQGVVEVMNLRTTTLRDIQGRAHIIPNSTIQRITLFPKEWSRAVVDVDVAYSADLDRVMEVMQEEAERLAQLRPEQILEKPQVLGVEKMGESGVTVRLIVKTAPGVQPEVSRELRKMIKQRFDQEKIEIASQRTVWLQTPSR